MNMDEHAAIWLTDYFILIGLASLYWDYLLTFGDEVKYFWRRPITKGICCFFLNRYLAIFANVPVWYVTFHALGRERCLQFGVYHAALYGITQVLVGCLLGIRVYALYGCNRTVGIILIAIGCVLMAVSGWSMGSPETPFDDIDCTFSLSQSGGVRVAIAWECVFAWDFIIICLTLWRSYQTTHIRGGRVKIPLVTLIARDGVKYFLGMLFANVANILTFYFAHPRVKGSLSTFASSVSVSMMSRLMINLHKDTKNIFDTSEYQGYHDGTTRPMEFGGDSSAATVLDDEAEIMRNGQVRYDMELPQIA